MGAAADFADEDASGSAMSSTSVDGTGDAETQAQGSVDDTVVAALGTSDANGDGAAAGTSATADFAAGEDASGTAMSSTSVDGSGDASSTADGSVDDQFALAFGDSMTMGDGAAAA